MTTRIGGANDFFTVTFDLVRGPTHRRNSWELQCVNLFLFLLCRLLPPFVSGFPAHLPSRGSEPLLRAPCSIVPQPLYRSPDCRLSENEPESAESPDRCPSDFVAVTSGFDELLPNSRGTNQPNREGQSPLPFADSQRLQRLRHLRSCIAIAAAAAHLVSPR